MAEQAVNLKIPKRFPSGNVVAVNVSEADYLQYYAAGFHEWVDGFVIKHAVVSHQHQELRDLVRSLLEMYFDLRPIGETIGAPFLLKLPKTYREPDIQVILKSNEQILTEYFTDGAADICVEIVSKGNEATDYGDKLREYEEAKVKEYWIIDPQRQEARFHRLNKAGIYKAVSPDDSIYTSPLLPDFELNTELFWQKSLPNLYELLDIVKKMLEKAE